MNNRKKIYIKTIFGVNTLSYKAPSVLLGTSAQFLKDLDEEVVPNLMKVKSKGRQQCHLGAVYPQESIINK